MRIFDQSQGPLHWLIRRKMHRQPHHLAIKGLPRRRRDRLDGRLGIGKAGDRTEPHVDIFLGKLAKCRIEITVGLLTVGEKNETPPLS